MNELTIIGFIVISPFVFTLVLIYGLVKFNILDSQNVQKASGDEYE